jgi:flagellar biogenesis protein FliO
MLGDSLSQVSERLNAVFPADTLQNAAALSPSTGGFIWRLLLAVAVGAVLLFVVTRFTKSSSSSTQGSLMELLDVQGLGPRQKAILLKVGSRVLLLGLGDGPPTRLTEFQGEEAKSLLEKSTKPTASFQNMFSSLLQKTKLSGGGGEQS